MASTTAVEFLGSDDRNVVLLGKVEVVLRVHLPTQTYLHCKTFLDQSFLDRVLYGRAVGMGTAKVAAPRVAMIIELDKCDRAELAVNRAQYRKQNRVIASDAHRSAAGPKNVAQLFCNALVRLFNRQWIDRQVAVISYPPAGKRIKLQHRVPRPNHG